MKKYSNKFSILIVLDTNKAIYYENIIEQSSKSTEAIPAFNIIHSTYIQATYIPI